LTQADLTVDAAAAVISKDQGDSVRAIATAGDIPVLNGIRGLLALWVLLGHTLIICGAHLPILEAPGVAVFAFMVMSGFLMAFHFRLREHREPWENPRTWFLFYVRRFFRIAPLFYLTLAVAFAFHESYMTTYYELERIFPNGFTHQNGIPAFDLTGLLLHVTFLFGLIPSQSDNNILPDWSIGLEMQFYFVFPFLMLALRKIGAIWFAAIALIILFAAQRFAPAFPQPAFLPLVLTAFVVGIFMSEALMSSDKSRSAALLVLAVFLASIRMPAMFQTIPLVMIFLINFPELFEPFKIRRLGSVLSNILGGRFGVFTGDRSYSVYLLHMLLLVPLVSLLARMSWFEHLPPLARFGVTAPAMIIACYALASITLTTIENPFIAIGRKVTASRKA
jgi:peptidoglycan/LPS O-acetylase OafA/YrhL